MKSKLIEQKLDEALTLIGQVVTENGCLGGIKCIWWLDKAEELLNWRTNGPGQELSRNNTTTLEDK